MPFDSATEHLLRTQGLRMRHALHPPHGGAPDRKEALLIQKRVDDILDRRPRPIAVASDGEVIYDNASPFVREQVAHNATGQAEIVLCGDVVERILPHGFYGSLEDPDDGAGTDGGVGLLDRP